MEGIAHRRLRWRRSWRTPAKLVALTAASFTLLLPGLLLGDWRTCGFAAIPLVLYIAMTAREPIAIMMAGRRHSDHFPAKPSATVASTIGDLVIDGEVAINPKLAPLIAELAIRSIPTLLSGDQYRNDLVYVDLAPECAEALGQLPPPWHLLPCDIGTAADLALPEAAPVPDLRGPRWRLARSGGAVDAAEAVLIARAVQRAVDGPATPRGDPR